MKYREEDDELRIRMLLETAPIVLDSYKVGDYFTAASHIDSNEINHIKFEEVSYNRILNPKEYRALQRVEEYKDVHRIKRLWKVIDIVNNVPIIVPVIFPGEKHFDRCERSLLYIYNEFLNTAVDEYEYDDNAVERILKAISQFSKLDDSYADSILLDSKYIPYENEMVRFQDLKDELSLEVKEIRKEMARRCAANRRLQKQLEEREIAVDFITIMNTELKKVYRGRI